MIKGLPWWLSGKESTGRCRFDPWVREIPLKEEVATCYSILAWEIHEQRSLAGYSSWVHQESDKTERLNTEGTSVVKTV